MLLPPKLTIIIISKINCKVFERFSDARFQWKSNHTLTKKIRIISTSISLLFIAVKNLLHNRMYKKEYP